MARKDRLFQIIQILRDGQLHRAQDLAARLGVSLRTIYRDMDALITSGVPIEGERGVGYMSSAAITLPPLNLSNLELEALHVGLALVGQLDDGDLRQAANSLSDKIDAVMPQDRRISTSGWGLAAHPIPDAIEGFRHMPVFRSAIRAMQKVAITYGDDPGQRVIRPLELDYWGRVWSVVAWCERDNAFVLFRVDQMGSARPLPASFVDEPGKTLDDYRRSKT